MELFTDSIKNDFFGYNDLKELAKDVKDINKLNKSLSETEFVSATKIAINSLLWPYPLWKFGDLFVTTGMGLDERLGKEAGLFVGTLINKLMICIYVFGLFKAIFNPVLNPAIYLFLPLAVSMWYTFTTTLVNSRLLMLIIKQQLIEEIQSEKATGNKDKIAESQD